MDKHQKIIKRQTARIVEPKTDFVPKSESYEAGANEPAESAKPVVLEQTIESLEASTPDEDCSASNEYLSLCVVPQFSQWHSELREIRWECDLNVWETCPYD